MKCYLILRENVESGPFTLEEMKTKTLLPTDLVWVEGVSQSWKFPYEVNGLAPMVQPLPQKERETFSDNDEKEHHSESRRVFVALPPQPTTDKQLKASPTVPEKEPAMETGFVQPLETLKARLEEHKARQFSFRSTRSTANWGWMAAVFLGLLGGAYMIKKMVDAMDERAAQVATAALPATNIPMGTPEEDKTYHNALSTEIVPVDTVAVEKPKKEVKKVSIKNLVNLSAGDYKKGIFGGINNLKLHVKNNSDEILDKVTIEVKYLKPNGDVVAKENVYVLAVAPKSTKTLEVPSSNRGVDLKYRIVSIKSHEVKAPMRDL